MGQLARGVEWPADESGVSLCALSLDEAARLVDGVDARHDDSPISFASLSFDSGSFESSAFEAEGGTFQPGSFEPGHFEPPPFESGPFAPGAFESLDVGDASLAPNDDDADPPTQRCPRWDPIANAPSAPADDAAVDGTPMGAPPFVRSLLTAW